MYIFFSQSNKTTIAISIKQKQKKREKDTFLINQCMNLPIVTIAGLWKIFYYYHPAIFKTM